MIDLVNAILYLRKFFWKFRHSLNCTTRVVPILQATLHRMVDGFVKQRRHYHRHPVSIWRVLVLVKGGRIHLIPSGIALTPYFHLVRFAAFSTSNPIPFTLSSICLPHICFGLPRYRCPFTAGINVFFRTLSYSLLTTCPYRLTPFAFAILTNVFFKPNISINSSLCFLSTNFTPHIDLTMALYVLLKIAISSSFKHHLHIIWK